MRDKLFQLERRREHTDEKVQDNDPQPRSQPIHLSEITAKLAGVWKLRYRYRD